MASIKARIKFHLTQVMPYMAAELRAGRPVTVEGIAKQFGSTDPEKAILSLVRLKDSDKGKRGDPIDTEQAVASYCAAIKNAKIVGKLSSKAQILGSLERITGWKDKQRGGDEATIVAELNAMKVPELPPVTASAAK